MSANSFDTPYNQRVRDKSRSILKKKLMAEPKPERFQIPSVHSVPVAFKDRKTILPDMGKMGGAVLSDMSEAQYMGRGMCGCGRDTSSGGQLSGGRDTSSGGQLSGGKKRGGRMIGLAKPRHIGAGFWNDLKRDLSHPKETIQGIGKAKTWSDAFKKSGQIIGNTLDRGIPLGAAALTAAETGSPGATIGAYKESRGLVDEGKKIARGSGKKSARGKLVSKLMKERGVSLGQASKIIKEEGLM